MQNYPIALVIIWIQIKECILLSTSKCSSWRICFRRQCFIEFFFIGSNNSLYFI